MTTGPLQIQPDIRREGPAGLTGPESTRRQPRGEGGGEARKEKAKPQAPKPPDQTRKETTTTPKPTNSSKKGGALQHQGRKPHEKHTGNGQPQQGHPRQERDARPKGTDPNTPHKTMQKKIREDEHTCPVCGQTHPRSMLKLEAKVVKVRAKL